MGKGIQKMVKNAAHSVTGGCTLTLFKRAAEHHRNRLRQRRGSRQVRPVFTVEEAHQHFQDHGRVPGYVESFLRGRHHLNLAT